jgi:hypothetical protein
MKAFITWNFFEILWKCSNCIASHYFSGVRVTRSLGFCVIFCRSLFVHLSFFFWPCLSFDLRILITPLVSLSSSYNPRHILMINQSINTNYILYRMVSPWAVIIYVICLMIPFQVFISTFMLCTSWQFALLI